MAADRVLRALLRRRSLLLLTAASRRLPLAIAKS